MYVEWIAGQLSDGHYKVYGVLQPNSLFISADYSSFTWREGEVILGLSNVLRSIEEGLRALNDAPMPKAKPKEPTAKDLIGSLYVRLYREYMWATTDERSQLFYNLSQEASKVHRAIAALERRLEESQEATCRAMDKSWDLEP